MTKYRVDVQEVWIVSYEVEAENEEAAKLIAESRNLGNEEDDSGGRTFSARLPSGTWPVTLIE